jgi:hypothetical protein
VSHADRRPRIRSRKIPRSRARPLGAANTAELFQSGHHQSPGQTPAPSHIRTISTEYRSGPCIPSGPSFKSARSTNSQPAMARIRTPVQTSPVMSSCCGSSPSGRAAPRRPVATSTDIGAMLAVRRTRRATRVARRQQEAVNPRALNEADTAKHTSFRSSSS